MFYLYGGKDSQERTPYSHLQKTAQVFANLCVDLPRNVGQKAFFDNWFTTLDLMLYFKKEGILAVGTTRGNTMQACPLVGNKEIKKVNRGDLAYRVDNNSGVIIVKWLYNNVAQLCSDFLGVCPMETIERWAKKDQARREIPCPPTC